MYMRSACHCSWPIDQAIGISASCQAQMPILHGRVESPMRCCLAIGQKDCKNSKKGQKNRGANMNPSSRLDWLKTLGPNHIGLSANKQKGHINRRFRLFGPLSNMKEE